MAKRPRLSPSGPFLGQPPGNFGYVSRILYDTGPDIITNVVEGAPGPPGTSLVDIPLTVAAADLPDLTWEAEGEVTYDILQAGTEDPRLFNVAFTLGLQGVGVPTPTAVVVNQSPAWPHWLPAEDGGNVLPINRGSVHWIWNAATYAPFAAGLNHIMIGLTFFGGGPPVHNAVVQVNAARLWVREYRGVLYTPP